jgi:hypothetical protein
MINDLDETIKQLLVKGVPLDLAEVDVVFDAPTEEWSTSLARPTINCYLYHLVENHELRANDWELNRVPPPRSNGNGNGGSSSSAGHSAQRRRLPFRIDVCYMVTAWTNEVDDEHRLLWRALAAMMRHSQLPTDMLQGVLANQEWPMPVRVAQPEGPFKNPADFWSSLEVPVKPSINLIVTLPLDPDLFRDIPLVLTKRIITYPGVTGTEMGNELPTVQLGGWVKVGSGKDASPVAGAGVRIVERGLETQTDEHGRFKFDQVPRGSYTLRATSEGAQTERKIDVPGDDYDLTIAGRSDGSISSGEKGDDHDTPGSHQAGKGRRR